jgi:glycosyl transferase family 2
MKLVMTLLVRDEEDVLEDHLRFHLAQGVDFAIVTDNRSVDRTPDILRGYERRGVVRTIREPGETFAQRRWVTRMARMARNEYGADWVVNSDADEFWWPHEGTLKSTLERVPGEYGVVVAPRVNFLPRAEDGRPFAERMTVREVASLNPLGRPLPPKVCHRGRPDVVVDWGNHGAYAPTLGPTWPGQPITIFHFPLRSYRHLENKAVAGGTAHDRNPWLPRNLGGWQSFFDLYRQGRLREHYDQMVLSDENVEQGIRAGRLVEDHRLRDFLDAVRSPSTPR